MVVGVVALAAQHHVRVVSLFKVNVYPRGRPLLLAGLAAHVVKDDVLHGLLLPDGGPALVGLLLGLLLW